MSTIIDGRRKHNLVDSGTVTVSSSSTVVVTTRTRASIGTKMICYIFPTNNVENMAYGEDGENDVYGFLLRTANENEYKVRITNEVFLESRTVEWALFEI